VENSGKIAPGVFDEKIKIFRATNSKDIEGSRSGSGSG
jgi:hypothetical protein